MRRPMRIILSTVYVFVLVLSGLTNTSPLDAAERNEYRVKTAFREVIHDASQSTCRVLCNGRRAAFGTIVSPDGLVLTKASELGGSIICHLNDGSELEARIVGIHEESDIALLKIDAKDLAAIQWSGERDVPAVGSWLATPGMGTIPVSVGVVSVLPRKISRRLPALGIMIDDTGDGPRVLQVVGDSGAAKAGIKVGDYVLQIDETKVKTREQLIATIRTYHPSEKIRVKIRRDDKELEVDAVLGELSKMSFPGQENHEDLGGPLSDRRAGFPLALQHDTVLLPNQCGGPLVNLDGKAIGINIARASRVCSYALPASTIKPLIAKLQKHEMVSVEKGETE